MDFTQNLKAFLKKLPLKDMSGHQKFLAVAAVQCGGDTIVEIGTGEVKAGWPKAVLGIKYNPAFYDRAQGAGWVNPTGVKGRFRITEAGFENLGGHLFPNSLPET